MVAAERTARRAPLQPEVFRVLRRARETEDTWTLVLDPPSKAFAFAPGQFTMLYAFGAGEVPISISGDPAHPERLVHTVRAVGPTTRAICAAKRGESLVARGPFGTAWPVEAGVGGELVIVAGGIGLAPLRPALYVALGRRQDFGRVVLLYGARTPDQLLYARELEHWQERGIEVFVTVDQADDEWRGSVGVVTTLIPRARLDPARVTAFVCGPEMMMRFSAASLLQAGIAAERVHLSLERNMKCALGHCGRCQFGPHYVCGDGPVFAYPAVEHLLAVPEL